MENNDLYQTIRRRVGGDISFGIFGPEKAGKTTLIRKVTERLEQSNRNGSFAIKEKPDSTDSCNIGIAVTSDGSFGELPREQFQITEKETIQMLQRSGMPFLVVMNSAEPYRDEAGAAVSYIEDTYGVACIPVNCEQLDQSWLDHILQQLLMEFPLTRVIFRIPGWIETLDRDHWLKKELFQAVRALMESLHRMRSIDHTKISVDCPVVQKTKLEQLNLSSGVAEVMLELQDALYYQILSEMTGTDIESEYQLISLVREMALLKSSYQKVASALAQVRQSGYAVIAPEKEEIRMEQPVLMKQGSRYGVKVHASAPSIHLISADLETEVAPIVGSENQAQDLIRFIGESRENQDGADSALIFGKSVNQLVEEGMEAKLVLMNEENQRKLQDIIHRLMNGSSQRLICIVI